MRKNIITISREFGSGGRTIGKEVAKRLNIPFYDKELIEKVARESGLNVNYIEEHGEYAPSSNPFAYAFLGHYIDGMSMNDYIWMMQRKIILELVQEGANYKYYTDQVWGLAQNYHLCLNSGEIGIDKCTELIVDLVK